jgi:hypothetical protein
MRDWSRYVPESVHGRGVLVFLLASRGSASAAAGGAVVTAANQVASRTEVLAAAVGARASCQQAGGTE